MYEQYKNINNIKFEINNVNMDKTLLSKMLKQKKHEEVNLLNAIANGNISAAALTAISNKLNTASEEVKSLEAQINSANSPKQYRILTYNYFKQLCSDGSRLLAHSSLTEKEILLKNV